MSKKHKKKNKSTNKSLNEVDEYGDKSTTQWESEDQTTVSGIDSTGSQNIENIHKSMTDRNRSEKESDAISTWIQDASDKIASDVSDNEKGDNSVRFCFKREYFRDSIQVLHLELNDHFNSYIFIFHFISQIFCPLICLQKIRLHWNYFSSATVGRDQFSEKTKFLPSCGCVGTPLWR